MSLGVPWLRPGHVACPRGGHEQRDRRAGLGRAVRAEVSLACCAAVAGGRGTQMETLEEVLRDLTKPEEATLQLQKLKRFRRLAPQDAARVADALDVLLSEADLNPPDCVSAMISAANAQAAQRRAASKERLQRVQDALERSFEKGRPAPEELSYGSWALVKLGDRGSSALRGLLQRCEQLEEFQAAQLSRLAWSLVTARLREEPLPLLQRMAERARSCHLHPHSGLAMLAWSFAKLQVKDEEMMQAVGRSSALHAGYFKPKELANVSWAFAMWSTTSPALEAVAQQAVQVVEEFKNQELTMLLWSFARLDAAPANLISAAAREVAARDLNAQHLANSAWAFARLMAAELARDLALKAQRRAHELKAQELSSLLWALAKVRADSALGSRMAQQAAEKNLGPQELVNLLWSAASMVLHDEQVLHGLTSQLTDLDAFGIQDLANGAWALAKLQQEDPAVFAAIARRLNGRCQEATSQQLANLAWAFATVAFAQGAQAVGAHAARRLAEFSSQGLANVTWAMAAVRALNFFEAVGDKLMSTNLEHLCQSPQTTLVNWAVDTQAILRSFRDAAFPHRCLGWAASALQRVGAELDRRGRLVAVEEGSSPVRPPASAESPRVLLDGESHCVLLKPSGWQVDTEGDEEDYVARHHAAREMLSQYMAYRYSVTKHPILEDVRCKKGFLHRLDVPSSGLILSAKTYSAYLDLLGQLGSGRLARDYLVLLHGLAVRREIWAPLAKEALRSWGAKSAVRATGRPATSHLKISGHARAPLGRAVSMAAVRIGTGRRHQIRVHAAHVGHPTVSDARYTAEPTFAADVAWCQRNFLHRYSLRFRVDGVESWACCELPEDLREALWQLRPLRRSSADSLDLWQGELPRWEEMPAWPQPLFPQEAPAFLCDCSWRDNWFLHLAEDAEEILREPEVDFAAPSAAGNQSRSRPWQMLQDLVQQGLCSRDAGWVKISGKAYRFNPFWITEGHIALREGIFEALCVPGLIVSDLLCSLHFALEARVLPAARFARRLRWMLPWVRHCLGPPWPLHPQRLEAFADRWAAFEVAFWVDKADVEVPHFRDLGRSVDRGDLAEPLRRCWPMSLAGACWPSRTSSLGASCIMCCDPRFPRGNPTCFNGVFTFEACCLPEDLQQGWPPEPEPVRTLTSEGAMELRELRDELRSQDAAAAIPDAGGLAELTAWLARRDKSPQLRLFPDLDLLVATNACVGRETEVPWFFPSPYGPSGLELAASAGALCGTGLPVTELVSVPKKRVLVPQQRPSRGFHKLEPYGLELMEPCRASPGCCQLPPCSSCCGEVEWRGLGILTGELRTNIAHFARDALWLHSLSNESLRALGAGQLKAERVLTKHAATECVENGACVRTDRQVIFEMEKFLEEVALEGCSLPTFDAGDPAMDHTVCFEVLAQRWRPWAGDAVQVQAFRTKALQHCRIKDQGMQKKIVLLQRDAATRRWKDEEKLIEHLKAAAMSWDASLVLANLGRLEPCRQVEALHDAMAIVAIHGADLTNMIFLPAKAAVLEVALECELEGGSVDSPFWRGPGTLMNGSVLARARKIWREQQRQQLCPAPGAVLKERLQGYPSSQFAKLARQANLLYTAVMDCSGAECQRQQEPGEFDRGWCTSDAKRKDFVEVDIAGRLIPTLWVIYDEYLRKLLPEQSSK
ncbi:unnamed protein product [Effrenium voratum]|uniref:Uncharacterized protein n=1 Tax=Effrenium voratum TaxID=2562239 RepID=A0AA36JQ58_9DINO|nr:unnamed protein product [Effrenium voratum]